jgi:hypothetical protein
MISIQTSRLQLIPLDHEMLQIWNLLGRESLEKFLNLLPNSWEVEKFYQDETALALRDFWLPMTKKFPLELISFCYFYFRRYFGRSPSWLLIMRE